MDSGSGPAVASGNALLCLRHVHKVREKGGTRFALYVPTFEIHVGEFIALVGANGCGKSTLLDMLALVLQPDTAEEFTLRVPSSSLTYKIMSLTEDSRARMRRSVIGY